MTTSLTTISANLTTLANLVYTVPIAKTATIICVVFNTLDSNNVVVNMFKKAGESAFRLIPVNTIVSPNVEPYRPQIDKLTLLPGEKIYVSAGSPTPSARATGLLGLPTMVDPLDRTTYADFCMSLALRDI